MPAALPWRVPPNSAADFGAMGRFATPALRKHTEGNEAASKTLLLYDVRCAHHKVPEAHVEQPQRFLHASEAMRQLAREHSQVFVLRTEIGTQYFPLWRGPREGYTDEILRVHTAAHLEGIRTRCDCAGSELTRLSAPPRVTAAAAAAATAGVLPLQVCCHRRCCTAGVQAWLAKQTAGSRSTAAGAQQQQRWWCSGSVLIPSPSALHRCRVVFSLLHPGRGSRGGCSWSSLSSSFSHPPFATAWRWRGRRWSGGRTERRRRWWP